MADVGERIRLLRKERDWKQNDLAEKSGVSMFSISRIETRKMEPSLEQLLAMSHAFGVPVSALDPKIDPDNIDKYVVDSLASKRPAKVARETEPGTIPLYVQNTAGYLGQFALREAMRSKTDCPPWLIGVPGAFAIQIPDMHMAPRFRAGETIFVHPKAPIRPFDDVIVLWEQEEGAAPLVFAGQYLDTVQQQHREQHEPEYLLLHVGSNEKINIPTKESQIMKVVGSLFP